MRVIPPRPFVDSIALRAALVWAFFRFVSLLGVQASGAAYPGELLLSLLVVLPVLVVIRVDMGRRSELIFLANLGHSFRAITIAIVLECLALEALFRIPFA